MRIEMLVKEIRQQKKITLKQLANNSNVSRTHINDIENNIKTPSLLIVVMIARALKVDIKETYKVIW